LPTNGSAPASEHRLAQDNIRQRLASLHDLSDPLKVSAENGRYRVTLTIPYDHEDTDSRR
jgi:hypothetical protein